MPSFIALAVLFHDCQKQTYVKQHNVALPFRPQGGKFLCYVICNTIYMFLDKIKLQTIQQTKGMVGFGWFWLVLVGF